MNISDLVHSVITGQWRLDRARTREMMEHHKNRQSLEKMYAGAQPGNRRKTPNQLSSPEDYLQAAQRIVLIRAARQMEEDMPFFDGLLGDFETFVIGDCNYLPNTGNPEADKVIRSFLEYNFETFDYSNRLDFAKYAQLAVRSMKRDGENGLAIVLEGGLVRGKYFSGDRIGNPMIGQSPTPGDYNGITADVNTERPISYQIFNRNFKTNLYVFANSYPASQFFHYYDPFRFEQYHGVTVFKNAIEHGFDMKQIIDFTKLNIKWRSSQLPYVSNEQGRPTGSGYEARPASFNGVPQPFSIDVDGVSQSFLKLGEGVMDYPNDFPNTQFVALMEELKRECCTGAKLPLEFVYRSQTGGVVQRFYADKAQKTFSKEKRWVKRSILSPVKNRMIQAAIDSGFLNLSRFGKLSTSPERFNGMWQLGGAVSVDYAREVAADIQLMDRGLMSPQDYALENGGDLATIGQQVGNYTADLFRQAKKISDESGQPFETALAYLSKRFPNPIVDPNAPSAEPDEPTSKADEEMVQVLG